MRQLLSPPPQHCQSVRERTNKKIRKRVYFVISWFDRKVHRFALSYRWKDVESTVGSVDYFHVFPLSAVARFQPSTDTALPALVLAGCQEPLQFALLTLISKVA